MSYTRKYRAPYTRKPDLGLVAANALYDEARRADLEAELAAMRREVGEADPDDAYEWGGPL